MLGIHIDSSPNLLLQEIKRCDKLGCKIVQLFVDPFFKHKKEYMLFANFAQSKNIKIVCHMAYSINCAKEWDSNSWWIKQFIMEIIAANKIGAFCVVVHLGKQLDITKEEALNNMFQSFLFVHTQTKDLSNVKILIETSSGQGSEMCYDINNLSNFYKKFSTHKSLDIQKRFGICLDTCHIFAAGYDIRDKIKITKLMKEIDVGIGLTNIKLIHLSDSKKDLGDKVDRHANIGEGKIGTKGLKIIANFFIKLDIPIILETPSSDIEKDLLLLKFA